MFLSKLLKTSLFKALTLASVVVVYSFSISSQAVFAATSGGGVTASNLVTTTNDLNSIKNNTAGYDPTASTNCSAAGSGTTTTSVSLNATGSDAWNATETQPYYVEELVINILQDLAQALKLPASSTVTQDHVEALVAWATEEGGNQGNSNAFNLWNMGFLSSYPQLYVGGSGAANGSTDSFVSFNAAVQAYTIEFTSSEQNRIGSILSQPNSTASQVLNAVANPSNYAGDGVWATDPSYASKLAAILSQTQSDYETEASVVIGPGATGNDHVPTSQLQYHIGSQTSNNGGGAATLTSTSGGCSGGLSPSGSGGNATCPNGQPATGNLAILCDAEQYQGVYYKWGGGHESYSTFRAGCPLTSLPSAASSSTAADPGPCATDCSGLVSVSVDQAFNLTALFTVASDGMMDTTYWKQIPISSAQPGDIVTLSDQTGHVEIVATNENGSLTTIGQHYTGVQASIVSSSYSYWTYAWTWIGPTNQAGTHS